MPGEKQMTPLGKITLIGRIDDELAIFIIDGESPLS